MRFATGFQVLCATVIAALVSSVLALAAEPPAEPVLRIDPGEHVAMINRIATDDAGRWLVTASDDKTARVWDLASGRLLNTLRPPIGAGNEGKLYAVALSPDGQTVALGGWTGPEWDKSASITLHERASGRLLRRIGGLTGVIIHMAFSADGRHLAASLGGKNGLRVFAVADGRLVAEDRDYGGASYSAHFGTDGRLLTTSFDSFLRLYRFDGERLSLLAKQAAPGGKQLFSARFSPDGRRIAVGFVDTPAVNVLDGRDLSFLFEPDTQGANKDLSKIAWSRDGAWLYAAGKADRGGQRFIRRWPAQGAGSGALQDWPVAGDTIMDLAALPGGRLAFGSGEPAWGVVSPGGERVLFHAPAVADFRGNREEFALSTDGSRVRFWYENENKSPAAFDSQSRALLAADNPGLAAPVLAAPGLNVSDWKDSTAPKLNGAPLMLKRYEISRSLALRPAGAGFVLGADWSLRAYDRNGREEWQKSVPEVVWAVNVSQDGRWVVAAYGDGTLRWHRATDGAEQLAFYPHPDRKRWVLWTPAGYYDASPGAEDLIGWHLNRGKDQVADFFPASRFRAQFHRPDVLAKVLETVDEKKAVELANVEAGRKAQAVSVAQVLPPVVEILSPGDGSRVSTAWNGSSAKSRRAMSASCSWPAMA